MFLFDHDDDRPVGMYDYAAPSHPIHEDERVAKALTELEEISRLEVVQRALTEELTRPYCLSARRPTACNVISLKARRDARKHSGARR